MFFTHLVAVLLLCGRVLGAVIPSQNTKTDGLLSLLAGVVPVFTSGNVAPLHSLIANNDTRLYHQNPDDNSIRVLEVTGAFTTGILFGSVELVPPGAAQPNTLIAAVALGLEFNEVHLYFISPSNILSEYIFTAASGWRGRPTCMECIDVNQFAVQSGNRVLYAMVNENATGSTTKLRVGFVSAGSPTGLTEAVFDAVNGWQLGTLVT
ncbi:hypothetical protein B0H19DRAFT_1073158 [Mycena capillaripes]|nr:hypothetical protein B0H19DRAFT_1073158 [Mycena capillaripes]